MPATTEQKELWLQNARMNTWVNTKFKSLHTFEFPSYVKGIVIVGAGNSALNICDYKFTKKTFVIANQSSLPWLIYHKIRVDAVFISDAGINVWKKIQDFNGLRALKDTKFFITTAITPIFFTKWKAKAKNVFLFHAILNDDKDFIEELVNVFKSANPMCVTQTGSVINMTLVWLQYALHCRDIEVYLKGVDMGYPDKDGPMRIPTIRFDDQHFVIDYEYDCPESAVCYHPEIPYVTSTTHATCYEQFKVIVKHLRYKIFTMDDNVCSKHMPIRSLR